MRAKGVALGFGVVENTHQNLSQRFRYRRLTYQFGKEVQGVEGSFVFLAWVTRTALQRPHLEIVVPTLAVAGLCCHRWMPCRQKNLSTQTPHLAWAILIQTRAFYQPLRVHPVSKRGDPRPPSWPLERWQWRVDKVVWASRENPYPTAVFFSFGCGREVFMVRVWPMVGVRWVGPRRWSNLP
jgi:hypothetical protein